MKTSVMLVNYMLIYIYWALDGCYGMHSKHFFHITKNLSRIKLRRTGSISCLQTLIVHSTDWVVPNRHHEDSSSPEQFCNLKKYCIVLYVVVLLNGNRLMFI